MSDKKLWKVISLSKTRGNRISRSLPYGEALSKFTRYKAELLKGDTLYMMQVLEVACGRDAPSVKTADEIVVEAPSWMVNEVPAAPKGFDALRRVS